MDYSNDGGFMPLLSPPPSVTSSTTTATMNPLPKFRSHPLRPGSSKESMFMNGIEARIMRITRKFANKDGAIEGLEGKRNVARRYHNFKDAAKDIEQVVNLLWASGTPSLQIPFLLNLASLVTTYIPAFPIAPKAMFRALRKFDYVFASLAQGRDLDTGETFSGFVNGMGLTITEKVRIRSLVQDTRVVVVKAMNATEFEAREDDDEVMDRTDDELEGEEFGEYDLDHDINMDFGMEMACVYDKTLVELGDTLNGPAIGIVAL